MVLQRGACLGDTVIALLLRAHQPCMTYWTASVWIQFCKILKTFWTVLEIWDGKIERWHRFVYFALEFGIVNKS